MTGTCTSRQPAIHANATLTHLRIAVLALALLLSLNSAIAGTFVANLAATPASPNDGNFTLTYSNPSGPDDQYSVQESVDGAGWIQIFSGGSSVGIAGRPPGSYRYRIKWKKFTCRMRFGEEICAPQGTDYSEELSVIVQLAGGGGGQGDPYNPPGAFTVPDDSDFPDAAIISPTLPPAEPANNQVGALQGNGGVSGGQASYSIPIVVPPGRKGMQPSVSLNYSSSSGNVVVGVGWSLSATSAITRCAATPAQDGFTAGVQYDESRDRLCLDGQRLMVEPGYSYGGTSSFAYYRTEIDIIARITRNGRLNGSATSFTVQYKDGRKSLYGSNANTRHNADGRNETLTWAIRESEDPSGNTITYEYWDDVAGEWPIKTINYTGFNETDGDRHVQFEYESRTDDFRTSYLAGGKSRSTRRLKTIKTEYQSQLVREYTLTYALSDYSKRSVLKSISECAYQGGAPYCLPTTNFTWQEQAGQFVPEPLTFFDNGTAIMPLSAERWLHSVLPQGDVDGDGVKDWPDLYVNAEGQKTGSHINRLANCFRQGNSWALTCLQVDFDIDGISDSFRTNGTYLEIRSEPDGNWLNTYIPWDDDTLDSSDDSPIAFADFNGDGWPDLLHKVGTTLYLYKHTKNVTSPYNSASPQTIYTYPIDAGTGALRAVAQVLGDMDGDGTPDIVISDTSSSFAPGLPRPTKILRMISEVGGNIQTPIPERTISGLGFTLNVDAALFHDINGDGLTDLLRVDPVAEGVDGFLQYRLNDGTDFIGGWNSLNMSIPMRNGNYINPQDQGTETYNEPIMSMVLVMDYNGDGKDELLIAGAVLASSCTNIQPVGWKCDHDLYGDYKPNIHANVGTPINSSVHDDSVRSFVGFRFDEDAAGSIIAASFPTTIVGSASQTAVIDATGDGLPDVVTVFGCRFASCEFNVQNSNYGGTYNSDYTTEGAWINRNTGTTTQTSNLQFDFEGYDLMSVAENGLGVRHEWTYRPLSSDQYNTSYSDFYDTVHSADDPDYFHFASSMYVVADHRASNGIGGLNSTKYRYRGAIYNNKGRGFQGFLSIITEQDIYATGDPLAGTDKISRTDFHQKWPKSSIVDKTCTWLATANQPDDNPGCSSVISKTTTGSIYEAATTGILGSPGATVFVAIDSQTSQINDIAAPMTQITLQTTTRTFDAYGNMTYESQDHTDAYTTNNTETTSTYAPADEVNWWVNKLTSRKVTHNPVITRHADSPSIEPGTDLVKEVTTSFNVYDSVHRLPTEVVVAGNDTPPLSRTVTTQYNAQGLPELITTVGTDVTGPRTVTMTYTNNGTTIAGDGYFPLTVTNALDHEIERHTDPTHGQPTSQWDANDLVTVTSYDAFGRVSEITPPGSPAAYQRYQWCDGGLSCPAGASYKIVTLAAGAPETNSYLDKFGRERQSSLKNFADTGFVDVKTDYDARGKVTFQSQPHDLSAGEYDTIGTYFENYDALGRLTSKKVDQADGSQFLTTYVFNGLTTDIFADSLQMSRTYNGLEQLVETVDAMGGIVRYAYDGAGNPIAIKDAKAHANGTGEQITASYNSLGHKEWVQDPSWGDGVVPGDKNFTYNALGEVLTEIDPNNDAISMDYDQLGRLVSRSVNGELNGMWHYDNTDTYKGLGLLDFEDSQFRADGSRLQKFYYYSDSSGGRKDLLQVTHRFYENDDQNDFTDYATHTFTDGYYARPKGLRYPGGSSLAYEYNTGGFVIKEKDPVSGIEYREITARSSRGQVKAASLANHGSVFQYSYSADYAPQTGQMNSILVTHSGSTLHNLSYGYDNFGNLKSRTTSYGVGATELLEYDALHRLTKSTRTIGSNGPLVVDYNYDLNGNITSKSDKAAVYEYSLTQPNRLVKTKTSTGATLETFGFDLNGNLEGNGDQILNYNAFNKPISIQEGIAGPETLFTYGANLLRYRQINPSGETVYYIDKLMEIETAGTEANYRHYISDVVILTKTGDLSDANPSIDYIHRDRLGSIVNITDHTGIIEEGRGFDAFGKPRNGDWSDKSPATINSSITDRGFTEHEHLDTHELIHMNGRGYDYGLGRFLSIDPIVQAPGNSQGWNPYSYIMNNPLSGTDPTGYKSDKEIKSRETTREVTKRAPTGSRIKSETTTTYTTTTTFADRTSVVSTTTISNNGVSANSTGYNGDGSKAESFSLDTDALQSQQQTTSSNGSISKTGVPVDQESQLDKGTADGSFGQGIGVTTPDVGSEVNGFSEAQSSRDNNPNLQRDIRNGAIVGGAAGFLLGVKTMGRLIGFVPHPLAKGAGLFLTLVTGGEHATAIFVGGGLTGVLYGAPIGGAAGAVRSSLELSRDTVTESTGGGGGY